MDEIKSYDRFITIDIVEDLMRKNNKTRSNITHDTGITQAKLSRCLSRDETNSQAFNLYDLFKLADYFNVSTDFLLGRSQLNVPYPSVSLDKVYISNAEICRLFVVMYQTGLLENTYEDDADGRLSFSFKTPDTGCNEVETEKLKEIHKFINYYLAVKDQWESEKIINANEYFTTAIEDRLNGLKR